MHFSLTAVLVSRFMLDLHETHRALAHQGLDLSTLQIMSIDIGQPHLSQSEDSEDWAVASNPTSDYTEPDIGPGTEASVRLVTPNAVRSGSTYLMTCFMDSLKRAARRPSRARIYIPKLCSCVRVFWYLFLLLSRCIIVYEADSNTTVPGSTRG